MYTYTVAPHAGAWIEMMLADIQPLPASAVAPTRERGLKCMQRRYPAHLSGSLPTRERGLKYVQMYSCRCKVLSLPTRERGLKCLHPTVKVSADIVAPHAGAWIEIDIYLALGDCAKSLPTRERGLKSNKYTCSFNALLSLPTRERGLKCPYHL